MTVSKTIRKVTHTGNGSATAFAFEFMVLAESELKVALLEIATGTLTELVQDTDYTLSVTLNSEAGGTVTYPISGSPMAATHKLIIYRDTAEVQPIDLSNQTRYYPNVIMEALDRTILMLQEVSETLSRAVVADIATDTPATYNDVLTQVVLATAAASAAQTAQGLAEAAQSAAEAAKVAAEAAENSMLEWAGAWTTSTAYAPSDIVSNNGSSYVCLVAHTSGTFSTDLSAGKWALFASKGDSGAGSGDMVSTNNLSDLTDADDALANLGGGAAGILGFKAVDEAAFKAALNLESGTDVQAYSAKLAALAAVSAAANKIPMFSGAAAATLLTFRDEDDFVSDDAAGVSSQQAIKAYVQTQVERVDAFKVISTVTVSSPVSEVEFDSSIFNQSIYDAYSFYFDYIVPVTDGDTFYAQMSDDGGTSYYTGATDYYDWGPDALGSYITISTDIGSDVGEYGLSGSGALYSPHLTSVHGRFQGGGVRQRSTGAYASYSGGGWLAHNVAINSIRFKMLSGNIESGSITILGRRKA